MDTERDKFEKIEDYPCKGCNKPINSYELCDDCAATNDDPFFSCDNSASDMKR